MADEREDERYEEGEYHFSDDQVNYEMDQPELKVPAHEGKGASFLSKLTPARKGIIGGVIFIVLLTVVFKMLLPTGAPPTEFSQTEAAKPVVAIAETPKVKESPPQTGPQSLATSQPVIQQPTQSIATESSPPAVASQTAVPSQPAMQPETVAAPASSPTTVASTMNPPSGQPMSQTTATQGVPAVAANTPMQGAQGSITQSPEMPPTTIPQQQMQLTTPAVGTVAVAPSSSMVGPPPTQGVVERLASLEQENAAMMSMLRTEYVQKLSDVETQNTDARNKMDDLSKRLNRLEASINQISQMLQNMNKPAPTATHIMEPATISHSDRTQTFTVQAIIPGRAWLKSGAGETVTVAEGDLLRSYGRITKIDPYDGIVNIDTGNKIITLSYGVSPE